ncbi:hypothetical protein COCOBI_18-3200 [Coccomyxa sp. Obi]|nr:hypothetical protein COCOBI_18-3200 [Coccomyxa sp. Obi]
MNCGIESFWVLQKADEGRSWWFCALSVALSGRAEGCLVLTDLGKVAGTFILSVDSTSAVGAAIPAATLQPVTGTFSSSVASMTAAQTESEGSSYQDPVAVTSVPSLNTRPSAEASAMPISPASMSGAGAAGLSTMSAHGGVPTSPSQNGAMAYSGVAYSLDRAAQLVATRHFDIFWRRTPDGAPLRWSQREECWRPGVRAAVVATVMELRASQHAATASQVLSYLQEKAVRQYGEVTNGHNFKKKPSAATLQRHRALAAAWRERFQAHFEAGTVPPDIQGLLNAYSSAMTTQGPGVNAPYRGTVDDFSSLRSCATHVATQMHSPFLAAVSCGGGPGNHEQAFPASEAFLSGTFCKRQRLSEQGTTLPEALSLDGCFIRESSIESEKDLIYGYALPATPRAVARPPTTAIQGSGVGSDLAADVASLAANVAELLRRHVQSHADITRLHESVQRMQLQLQAQHSLAEDSAFLFDDIFSM